MNNSCVNLILVLLVLTGFHTSGKETNEIYLTELSIAFSAGPDGQPIPEHITDPKITRESLPAQKFPEGNWGDIEKGFQLSLRFSKGVYTNGETITAILLLRNATNQLCDAYLYPCASGVCDGPASFYATSDSGNVLPRHSLHIPYTNPRVANVPQLGYQHKILEHLNDGYDLTNGVYNLQAEMRISYPGTNKPEFFDVKSATVKIKVEGG